MDSLVATKPKVDNLNPLPAGTRLQEFVIERLIGIGGFGIVYQANDTLLRRTVAIKEYMPTTMASRGEGMTVSLRSESFTQDFDTGKESFIDEARMLARFKHPALVEVFRFWEQNSTAYMATPFYQGRTLKESLRALPGIPDEATLRATLMPVLDALEHMHLEQVYHRDISPENIMILEDGKPVLLDLGAARRLEGMNTQALTVLVKPGYAPIEQYAGDAAVQQGPWTDIYAWGATAYFALTGKPPPPSASRIMSDSIVKLADLKPKGYATGLLAAIDAALAVRPDDRPQSVEELKSLIPPASLPDEAEETLAVPQQLDALVDAPTIPGPAAFLDDPSALPAGQQESAFPAPTEQSLPLSQTGTLSSTASPPGKRSPGVKPGVFVGAGLCVAVLLGAFWWFAQPVQGPASAKVTPAKSEGVPNPAISNVAATSAPVTPGTAVSSPAPATSGPAQTTSSAVSAPATQTGAGPQPVAPVPVMTAGAAELKPDAVVQDADLKLADKPAVARFGIKPWGEIYINGENRGVSPPVKALSLPAGEYNIEVRNGDYPPYRSKVSLKAGQVLKINHAFEDLPAK